MPCEIRRLDKLFILYDVFVEQNLVFQGDQELTVYPLHDRGFVLAHTRLVPTYLESDDELLGVCRVVIAHELSIVILEALHHRE